MKLGITTLVLALVVALATPVGAGSGTPEDYEQWLVYDVNRARWDPLGYAAEMEAQGYDLGPAREHLRPRPPLVLNPQLNSSASAKAIQVTQDWGSFNSSTHCFDGVCPNELVKEHGYQLANYFPDEGNGVEAYWASSGIGYANAADFMQSTAHWYLFDRSASGTLQPEYLRRLEVGAGYADCSGACGSAVFVHAALRNSNPRFITGVVFDDGLVEENGIMDLGEGLGGVTVTVGSTSVTSNAGGGYALQVPTGTHTITANGYGSATVKVGSYNVGVDFVKGEDPVVRAYEKCKGLEPTILGTDGDDILYGTPGPDVIHGLDGNDRIYGLGGDDVICGGDGKDKLFGGSGDDSLYGGRQRDVLKGGGGADLLRGDQGRDTLKGGSGGDTLVGKGGPDKLYGGAGDDLLRGNGKADLLVGDAGFDTGIGGGGIDTCDTEVTSSCP